MLVFRRILRYLDEDYIYYILYIQCRSFETRGLDIVYDLIIIVFKKDNSPVLRQPIPKFLQIFVFHIVYCPNTRKDQVRTVLSALGYELLVCTRKFYRVVTLANQKSSQNRANCDCFPAFLHQLYQNLYPFQQKMSIYRA